jgi:hypothetical protein
MSPHYIIGPFVSHATALKPHMLRHLARAAPRHARPSAACHASTAAAAGVQGSLRVPGFSLERGSTLDVELVYKSYGSPGKPCIVHPTSFDAKDVDLEYAIGPGRILDTDAYFVVVPVRHHTHSPCVCRRQRV